jgi:hypothetical protein
MLHAVMLSQICTCVVWVSKKIKPKCRGEAYLTRFADDFVGNFQYGRDAERFQKDLTDRFGKFGLELAEEKTRVMRFGRFVRSASGDLLECYFDFIDVAPGPVFAGLERFDDGMVGAMKVFCGVAVLRKSQQPTWPHSRQSRKCTQRSPVHP